MLHLDLCQTAAKTSVGVLAGDLYTLRAPTLVCFFFLKFYFYRLFLSMLQEPVCFIVFKMHINKHCVKMYQIW